MALPDGEPLNNVRLTRRAQKDLEKLLKTDRKNFGHVWEDIKRLGQGNLPQPPKALKGFSPALWQIDSGDFRIFHTWEAGILWIRGVLVKSEQAKRLRGMR